MQTFATSKSRVQQVLEVLQNLDDDFILWERAVSQVIDTVTSVVRGYDSVRKPRELLLQSKIGCHKFTSAGGCGSGRESMRDSMSPDPCMASEPCWTLIETSVSANRCRNCFYPKPSAYAGHPKPPRMPARPSLPQCHLPCYFWIRINIEFRTTNVQFRRNPHATSSFDIPYSVFDIQNSLKGDSIELTASTGPRLVAKSPI